MSSTSSEAVLWALAGAEEVVPDAAVVSPAAHDAIALWTTTATACGHPGVLTAALPHRLALCPPCAARHAERAGWLDPPVCGLCGTGDELTTTVVAVTLTSGSELLAIVPTCTSCEREHTAPADRKENPS
jgi:hypothetical protein